MRGSKIWVFKLFYKKKSRLPKGVIARARVTKTRVGIVGEASTPFGYSSLCFFRLSMYFCKSVSAFTKCNNFLVGLLSSSETTAAVSAGKYLSPPNLSNGRSLAVKSSQPF